MFLERAVGVYKLPESNRKNKLVAVDGIEVLLTPEEARVKRTGALLNAEYLEDVEAEIKSEK